nr:cadherin-like beta sandwich domain-containing protein [uncultured Mucilaginibacter sp.]
MNLNLTTAAHRIATQKNQIDFKKIALLIIGICLFTGFMQGHATAGAAKKNKPLFLSNNARLSKLTVSLGTLSPAFDPGRTNYTDTIANAATSVKVSPTREQSGATIKVNGVTVASGAQSANLTVSPGNGHTNITIVVTAEDGVTTKTYIISVHRLDNRTTVTSIDLIEDPSVGGPNPNQIIPAFSDAVTNYTYANAFYPANDSLYLSIVRRAIHGPVTIKVNGITAPPEPYNIYIGYRCFIPLHEGTNNVDVVVTAEDKVTTKTFHFTIQRPYNTADLSQLEYYLADPDFYIKPLFSKDSLNYLAVTKPDINSIYLGPKVIDPYAIIKINGVTATSGAKSPHYSLVTGTPTATVVVTARDGITTKTYIVNARHERLNANLASVTLSTGSLSPAFSPTRTSYTVKVSSTTNEVQLTATSEDSTATFKVHSNTDPAHPIITTGSVRKTIAFTKRGQVQAGFSFDVLSTDFDATHTSGNKTYHFTVIRTSNNTNLRELRINNVVIARQLDTTFDFKTTVSTSSITLKPTIEELGTTIKINGITVASGTTSPSIPLALGDNAISLLVTAQDTAITQTYTAIITRVPGNKAVLADIVPSAGELSPAFSPDSVNSTVTVSTNTTSIKIKPVAGFTYPNVTAKVNGVPVAAGAASASITLIKGNNVIPVEVTSADSSQTFTYIVNVVRQNANADVASITLSEGELSPVVSANVRSYKATVSNATTSITISAIAQDTDATVAIYNSVDTVIMADTGHYSVNLPLTIGTNNFTIRVTSRTGGDVSYYSLHIIRPSNVASLASLSVNTGTLSPAFDPGTLDYMLPLSNEIRAINITAIPTDPNATIKINFYPYPAGTTTFSQSLDPNSNIIEIAVTSQDRSETWTYVILARPSNNTNLDNLSISTGPLSPAFAINTLNYTASVPAATTSTTVMPYPQNPNARITVNGIPVDYNGTMPTIPLALGANTISTVVTSQDGTKVRTYKIVVTRLSNNTNLAGLTLSSGTLSPAFIAGTRSYTADVSNATSSITVTPVAANPHATMEVNNTVVPYGGTSAPVSLSVGSNLIYINVTAQDHSKTITYAVTVNRAPATFAFTERRTQDIGPENKPGNTENPSKPIARQAIANKSNKIIVNQLSDNANLTNLTINPGHLSPAFAAGTLNYEAWLTHATTSVDITATRANPNATISVHGTTLPQGTSTFNQPLNLGTNVIEIVVKSQDGSKSNTYVLFITRPSDNSNLRNLSITSGPLSPAFAINTLNYTASVPADTTSIRVRPFAQNSNAPITVNGTPVYSNNFSPPIPLALGHNTISVVVTSQDSSKVRTYKIVVTRLSNNTNLASLTLSSGTLSPAFAAGTRSYTTFVGNATSSITVTPVAANPHAKVEVNNVVVPYGGTSAPVPLSVGSNLIYINVTAQDLSKTITYAITITRAPASFALRTPQIAPDLAAPNSKLSIAGTLQQPIVRQAVSPNGDGINDILLIDGVESFADNTLKIMNRDGNLVFEKAKYDNLSNGFDGHSGINGKQLPPGTYFYSLEYASGDGKAKHKTGFFVLKY